MKAVVAAMEAFAQVMLRERPDLGPEYFRIVRAGSVQIGVGSAVTPKLMIRVRGPSDDPADDELLESKKIGDLGGLRCLKTPTVQPTLRVIDGSKQLGRLKYNIVAAGPETRRPRGDGPRRAIAGLVDPQLGSLLPSGSFDGSPLRRRPRRHQLRFRRAARRGATSGPDHVAERLRPETTTRRDGRLEKRYRQEASKLVDDLLRGWRELGAR